MCSLMCVLTRCISPFQTAALARWGHCGVEHTVFLMRQNIKMLTALLLRTPGQRRRGSCRPLLRCKFREIVFCGFVQSPVVWILFISLRSEAVTAAFFLWQLHFHGTGVIPQCFTLFQCKGVLQEVVQCHFKVKFQKQNVNK